MAMAHLTSTSSTIRPAPIKKATGCRHRLRVPASILLCVCSGRTSRSSRAPGLLLRWRRSVPSHSQSPLSFGISMAKGVYHDVEKPRQKPRNALIMNGKPPKVHTPCCSNDSWLGGNASLCLACLGGAYEKACIRWVVDVRARRSSLSGPVSTRRVEENGGSRPGSAKIGRRRPQPQRRQSNTGAQRGAAHQHRQGRGFDRAARRILEERGHQNPAAAEASNRRQDYAPYRYGCAGG